MNAIEVPGLEPDHRRCQVAPERADDRLAVEPQVVLRLELVDSFARIAGGKGGYWEDNGYQWYAGI